jgi:putative peptidoglycan lipid II flippase
MSIKIFAPGYYARQDTRSPVRIGIVAMLANMALNIVFYLSGYAHVGLATATTLAAFLNAGLLCHGLIRDGVFRLQAGWLRFAMQILVANALMLLLIFWLAGDWQDWLGWTLLERVVRMSWIVFGGIGLYGITLLVCGLRWRHIYR